MSAVPVAVTGAGPDARRGRRGRRADQVVVSSGWMLATMVLMAASGLAFWLLAARLQAPEEVGYAGSLVTAMTVLALFAQVGLEVTLLQVLPRSSRAVADVVWVTGVVAVVGAGLGLGYAVVLQATSPELAAVLGGRLGGVELAVLVAATSVNALSDSALLAVSRLRANLVVNGVLMGAVKLVVPLLLVSSGAMGLVLAVGLSALVAAVVSTVVVLRAVAPTGRPRAGVGRGATGRRRVWGPSPELLGARRFAGAGYVVSVLDVVPFLVFPPLLIGAYGAATGAAYFLGFQVVVLLLAVGFTLSNAMYAEVTRRPQEAAILVRRTGLMVLVAMSLGAVVVALAAPLVMRVFGPEYVAEGVPLLRALAGSAVLAGLCSWSALRLRVQGRLGAMLTAYLGGTTLVLVLAWWWADLAVWAVPLAWGVGRGATLLANLVAGRRR